MHTQTARRVRAKYITTKTIEDTLAALARCGVPLESCTYAVSPDGQFLIRPNADVTGDFTAAKQWSAWEQSRGE